MAEGDGTVTETSGPEKLPHSSRRIQSAWKTIKSTPLVCADCGGTCQRTGPTQKFCPECSDKRAQRRSLKWANKNPPPPERTKRYGKEKRSRLMVRGAEINEATRSTLVEIIPNPEQFVWVRRLSVPFDYASSKNHAMQMGGYSGHVFLRKESRQYREMVRQAIADAVADAPVVIAKLWIDLIIQKPNHRGDAVNALDMLMDSIKEGCGVDDRWFCLLRLDWQIVKHKPQILIGLAQKDSEECRACSYCGRVLSLQGFSKNIGMPQGRSRACLDCNRLAASQRKPKGIKLTQADADKIRELLAGGETVLSLARKYKVSKTTIKEIRKGSIWC